MPKASPYPGDDKARKAQIALHQAMTSRGLNQNKYDGRLLLVRVEPFPEDGRVFSVIAIQNDTKIEVIRTLGEDD
jgi:hypothetical protein